MSESRARTARVREARRRRRRLVTLVAVLGGVLIIGIATIVGIVTFGAGDTQGGGDVVAGSSTPTPAATRTPTVGPSASATPVPTSEPVPAATTPPAPEPAPAGFNKSANSLTDPNSPWVVVNKINPLVDGRSFVPALEAVPGDIPNPNGHRLHPFTVAGLTAMSAAARAEAGVTLVAQSGYRSYESQVGAFQYYSDLLGVAEAEKTSARPGFSEHQTGFALDILDTASGCTVDGPCFGESTAGQWLAANAWRFGFILRYPADKVEVTGYEYEPWHFRYVGPELSTEMHNQGVTTLEEFFGVPGSTEYR